jgi:hypothetical protein
MTRVIQGEASEANLKGQTLQQRQERPTVASSEAVRSPADAAAAVVVSPTHVVSAAPPEPIASLLAEDDLNLPD